MNYYLAMNEALFVLGAIPISAVLLLAFVFLIERLLDKMVSKTKPQLEWTSIRATIAVILSILIVFPSMFKTFNDAFNGKMKLCYISELDGEKRLSIWFEYEQSANMIDVYTHRFISYNIKTGKAFGVINPAKRIYWNDFSWYGPFGTYAWGYSDEDNLRLMDIFTPRIIYDEKDIIEKIPKLKPIIKISPTQTVYTKKYNDIAVATVNGDIYWINPYLEAIKGKDINEVSLKEFKKVGKSTWLPTWKERTQTGDNKWIDHPGSEGEAIGCILTYEDSSGKALNRIDLCAMFYPETRPYALLEHKDETLIFVTRKGYSLSALRTDPKTGKIMGQINYFD